MKRRATSSPPAPTRRSSSILGFFAIAFLALVLSGCTQHMEEASRSAGYVGYLPVAQGESTSDIESRTGGRVLAISGGQALVELPAPRAGAFRTLSDDTEPNVRSFGASGRSLVWSEGKSYVWSEGKSYVWSEGKSYVWSEGKSYVWSEGKSYVWSEGKSYVWSESDGSYKPMPENTFLLQHMGLEAGHDLANNLGAGVTIAVIDSGLDLDHPMFSYSIVAPMDFVDGDTVPQEAGDFGDAGYGHGTMVAGVVRQVALAARIMPIRVLDQDGMGYVADVAAGIHHAVDNGADIINLSLGSATLSPVIMHALEYASGNGVLVVTSSGNTAGQTMTYPASHTASGLGNEFQVSVASVGTDDVKSEFSSYHPQIELAAVGEMVYGPAPEMGVWAWDGTSIAAPMVSGALALALGEDLAVERSTLTELVKLHSADIYADGLNADYEGKVGEGRLDIAAFLEQAVASD